MVLEGVSGPPSCQARKREDIRHTWWMCRFAHRNWKPQPYRLCTLGQVVRAQLSRTSPDGPNQRARNHKRRRRSAWGQANNKRIGSPDTSRLQMISFRPSYSRPVHGASKRGGWQGCYPLKMWIPWEGGTKLAVTKTLVCAPPRQNTRFST